MKVSIHYLFNSGFLVKTDRHFFLFDYYLDTPQNGTLAQGVIRPEILKEKDAVVFISHRHYDHYNPAVFTWQEQVPGIRYIVSDDIQNAASKALLIHPGETVTQPDFSVKALKSTDEGSAFLIKTEGLTIYHAGDLNWWHWNGETEEYNREMARQYKQQIDLLRGESIDLAFIPMDPRLEDKYLLGIDYFMKTVGAKLVIPMHFSNDLSAFDALQNDERAEEYRKKIHALKERGDTLEWDSKSNSIL